jgi:hypothetical protein
MSWVTLLGAIIMAGKCLVGAVDVRVSNNGKGPDARSPDVPVGR